MWYKLYGKNCTVWIARIEQTRLLTVWSIISVWYDNSDFSTKWYFTIGWFITRIMKLFKFTFQSQILIQVWFWDWWHCYFSHLTRNKFMTHKLWLVSFQSNLTFLVHKEAVALPIFRRLVAQLLTEFLIHYFSYFRWVQLALVNFQMKLSYFVRALMGRVSAKRNRVAEFPTILTLILCQ